jgi:hypothetical protein
VATSDQRLDSAKRPQNCHRHAVKRLKAPENWKPSTVSDFARHPYMLMNLGQRDEPSPEGSVKEILPVFGRKWDPNHNLFGAVWLLDVLWAGIGTRT